MAEVTGTATGAAGKRAGHGRAEEARPRGGGGSAGDREREFARLTGPYRTELLAHCYRMLGSPHDAEDLVQETYLRAWRSYGRFEGRSSLRVWLYRIATNACLNALRGSGRTRVLPSGLGGPGSDPDLPLVLAGPGTVWVQPLPDALPAGAPAGAVPAGGSAGGGTAADPAEIAVARGSVRLALVAAVQHLPPRQRAVLLLREVLAWPAAEVAELLGTTTAAVNSALQRARAQLARLAPVEEETAEPSAGERRLVDAYADAFERADTAALIGLLREDIALEMPPHLTWFRGAGPAGRFLTTTAVGGPGVNRSLVVPANGQLALATYRLEPDGRHHAHAIQLLTAGPAGIARIIAYLDPGLFPAFGLPPLHPGS